jgi:hypothetical protein
MNVPGLMKNKDWSDFSNSFIKNHPELLDNILDGCLSVPTPPTENKQYFVKLKGKPYLTLEVLDKEILMWFTRFPQRRVQLDLDILPNLVDTLIEIQNIKL